MKRTPNTFGERLARLRAERGMSQQELARLIDVREKDISRWENNHNLPTQHDKIVRLAAVLRTTTDYLLGAKQIRSASLAISFLSLMPLLDLAVDRISF